MFIILYNPLIIRTIVKIVFVKRDLSHSCNKECVKEFRFLYFWDPMQQYHKKFVYILERVIAVANAFQLYLAIGLSF